jgi:hypothetical protein
VTLLWTFPPPSRLEVPLARHFLVWRSLPPAVFNRTALLISTTLLFFSFAFCLCTGVHLCVCRDGECRIYSTCRFFLCGVLRSREGRFQRVASALFQVVFSTYLRLSVSPSRASFVHYFHTLKHTRMPSVPQLAAARVHACKGRSPALPLPSCLFCVGGFAFFRGSMYNFIYIFLFFTCGLVCVFVSTPLPHW